MTSRLVDIQIIEVISSQPHTVLQVANALHISKSRASDHLKALADKKQIKCKINPRDMREHIYGMWE
jgi:DNA-binding MarR family transcriptional regulator